MKLRGRRQQNPQLRTLAVPSMQNTFSRENFAMKYEPDEDEKHDAEG